MENKTLEGIAGPGFESQKKGEVTVNFPDCIQIKTQKDSEDIKAFVAKIITTTNENALNLIAAFVEKQNQEMNILVKKLGAK